MVLTSSFNFGKNLIFTGWSRNKFNKINIEAKKIATKLKIDDRVQQFHEAEAFITVKDHKDNFPNFPTFRLINPSKSEIGKIS